jgi:hypothetical protein
MLMKALSHIKNRLVIFLAMGKFLVTLTIDVVIVERTDFSSICPVDRGQQTEPGIFTSTGANC